MSPLLVPTASYTVTSIDVMSKQVLPLASSILFLCERKPQPKEGDVANFSYGKRRRRLQGRRMQAYIQNTPSAIIILLFEGFSKFKINSVFYRTIFRVKSRNFFKQAFVSHDFIKI